LLPEQVCFWPACWNLLALLLWRSTKSFHLTFQVDYRCGRNEDTLDQRERWKNVLVGDV
jgi:hypothetical protein